MNATARRLATIAFSALLALALVPGNVWADEEVLPTAGDETVVEEDQPVDVSADEIVDAEDGQEAPVMAPETETVIDEAGEEDEPVA